MCYNTGLIAFLNEIFSLSLAVHNPSSSNQVHVSVEFPMWTLFKALHSSSPTTPTDIALSICFPGLQSLGYVSVYKLPESFPVIFKTGPNQITYQHNLDTSKTTGGILVQQL